MLFYEHMIFLTNKFLFLVSSAIYMEGKALKKQIMFLVTMFIFMLVPALVGAAEKSMTIDGAQLSSVIKHEEDAKIKLTSDVRFPKLSGATLTSVDQKFNEQVKVIIDKEVSEFQKNAKEFARGAFKNNNDVGGSHLKITYEVISHTQQAKPFISILFTIQSSLIGTAHPNVVHRTLNFDFKTGNPITLSQLFKPGSGYIAILNEYCAGKLSKKTSQSPAAIKQASAIIYDNWNLKPAGLLITFDEFPHVLGPVSVLVPYKIIKQELVPQVWVEFTK